MLLGKVQSGKTRTYISAMALAFDNGYDVAVILTKNSRALVEQTRRRLDEEFNSFIEDAELEVFDIMTAPTTFTAFEREAKLIFVAKKQKDNLRRLIELLKEGCPALASQKMLVIDDEADAASIGYSKQKDVIEARTIAKAVSDVRSASKDVSFLQVTATPYSLYLQPSDIVVGNSPDFRPTRPRFTKLVPVPEAYVGGDVYFGEAARDEELTVERSIHVSVSPNELEIVKSPDRRRFKVEEVLEHPAIESMRRAYVTFLVGGCIQRLNGIVNQIAQRKLRYSFLIHSEAARGSHEWQERIVSELNNEFTKAAMENTARFQDLVREAYQDLSESIRLAGTRLPNFEEVIDAVKGAVRDEYITINKVNSDNDIIAMLDKDGQLRLRSPLNFFIGGQVLDRGVTLANLLGFYYGRRPHKFQQDTVLQHSRMYGYRRQDLAVTRFYTSNYIRNAMFEMEEFDSALRMAISDGHESGVQFIRTAEGGGIIPCSPNKILVATTQTLKPFRRILPIGFNSDYMNRISGVVNEIDRIVLETCGFNADEPVLVPLATALKIFNLIERTLLFEPKKDDVRPFNWQVARDVLGHLANQHPDRAQRGQVYIWAANGRQSARYASAGSHARFIETPDSEKTEGRIARAHAHDHPIMFLLRQEGAKEKGWRDAPFYWPVIRAQKNTPTTVYSGESLD
ncbi:MAG: DEAD/DEAH box helicase family protein [Phycisphaeraceae bacterium]|nr:DEAD/DEAH box helicase family protein [Phycisphaeraceae bacterium]